MNAASGVSTCVISPIGSLIATCIRFGSTGCA